MMNSQSLSIVIPTFNRRAVVGRAIDSALAWVGTPGDLEIIIVDDGSNDGTLAHLRERYAAEMALGQIALLQTPENLGAAGAKNYGASAATGEWLLFLDSDDALLSAVRPPVTSALAAAEHCSVVFFRCADMITGALMGAPAAEPREIDVYDYFRRWTWGECLPIVRRTAFRRYPYDPRLRGHEGLAYARMLKHVAPGVVYPTVVRAYDASGNDRLSRRSALWRRGLLLAAGFAMTIREFWRELGPGGCLSAAARCLYYVVVGQWMRGVDAVSEIKRK